MNLRKNISLICFKIVEKTLKKNKNITPHGNQRCFITW